MESLDTIGKRLKWARKNAQLSQHDLEEKSGVAQSVISRLERGTLKKSTNLVMLANACNVSVFWLQTGHGDPMAVLMPSKFPELEHAVEKFNLNEDEMKTVERHAIDYAMQLFLNK